MKYNTVIFDLDGTLLNTLDDLADSVNAMLAQEGCQLRTKEEIMASIGEGAKNLIERSLPTGTKEEEVLRCLAIFRAIYVENMQNKTRPYEGILDVLKKLKASGVKVGIVSNKPDEATKEISRQYFGEYVGAVIGDGPGRKKKPEPDNVYEVMNQLGSHRDKTLYVGDSDIDMITAKTAGLVSVGVTWGYRSRETISEAGADYMIDEPASLIPLVTG